MQKTLATIVAALLFAGGPLIANAGSSESQKVDDLFSNYSESTPGCSVAVDWNNEAIHLASYGMADLEQGVSIRPETAFYAASVSKQFVAMSALLLQEQGKIDLDAPVRRYVTSLPEYADRVTTRNLLHHTGGVRDYFTLFRLGNRLDGLVVTESRIMEMLERQEGLSFEPGEKYAYSNSAYFLISQIVKEVDGRNLNEFAQAHIFGPLGMGDSRFQHNHRYIVPRKAHGYAPYDYGGYLISDSTLDVVGSGGMYSTVLDLTKWARNFRDNQLEGGAGTIDDMQISGVLNNGEKTDYGLGIGVREYRGLTLRAHGGALAGYRTYLMMFPDQAFSVALLCNDQEANTGELTQAIAEIYLADEFTEVAADPESDSDVLEDSALQSEPDEFDHAQFAGSYYSREVDGTQVLSIVDSRLHLGSIPLEYIEEDKLGSRDFGFELEFARDENGNLSAFTFNGARAAGVVFRIAGGE